MAPLALHACCCAPSLTATNRPIKVISFIGLQRIAPRFARRRHAALQQNRQQKKPHEFMGIESAERENNVSVIHNIFLTQIGDQTLFQWMPGYFPLDDCYRPKP